MKSDYQPIPGLGNGGTTSFQIGLRSRLYAGPDHLLLVQSSGYREEYRRIFYRDIRYLVARNDNGQAVQAWVSGGFVVLMMLLNLTPMSWWIPDLLALPFLAWFVVNWIRGPVCQCYASTEVQTLELPLPRRFGKLPVMIEFLKAKSAASGPVADREA